MPQKPSGLGSGSQFSLYASDPNLPAEIAMPAYPVPERSEWYGAKNYDAFLQACHPGGA